MEDVKIKKRSKILSLLFSLVMPGLGHIYNGLLLKGIFLYFMLLLITFCSLFILLGSFLGLIITITITISFYIYIIIDCLILSLKNNNYKFKIINKWYIYIILIILHFSFNIFFGNYIIENLGRYRAYVISGRSNEPTLILNEKVFIDKWYYKFANIKHGDIIIFKNPENDPNVTLIIKRCVGLPGDKVEIRDYKLYLNGNLIDLYNIKIDSKEDRLNFYKNEIKKINKNSDDDIIINNIIEDDKKYGNYGPLIVPENTFFCLGDNRTNSMDSRDWGPISNKALIGKLKYIYWSNDFSRIGKDFK
jgi:signal peptidase I